MKTYKTFTDIINQWPSPVIFGHDIGVEQPHANNMKARDSIPSKYWLDTEMAAKKRGFTGITVKILAQIKRDK